MKGIRKKEGELMDGRMLTPDEIALATIEAGTKKANLPFYKMILLGILAGIFIGFGAHGSLTVMQTLKEIDIGLMKLLGAVVFPVGLMLVVIAGAELFTGNNLMALALMSKRITFSKILKNWVFVYLGNFIGSVLLVFLIYKSGLVSDNIKDLSINIALSKINLTFSQALIRGILCNILVVLAVWMATGSKDISSKIFAIWFPIMLFVLAGYEHSVANMFYIPLGKLLGANIKWSEMLIKNLIPVTIGNILGGAIFVCGFYYLTYVFNRKGKNEAKELSSNSME